MPRTTARVLALATVAALVLAGCGFVKSGQRGSTKPDTFLLRGYVSVGRAPAGAAGAPCQAQPGAEDIHAGGAVRVADPDGHTLAAGALAGGVLALAGGATRCNFPFEIPGVSGGVDRYVIGVGNRPTVAFPARELREGKPAVITVDP